MDSMNKDKYRVTTYLTRDEKDALRALAYEDGRSMGSYLRFILREYLTEAEYE